MGRKRHLVDSHLITALCCCFKKCWNAVWLKQNKSAFSPHLNHFYFMLKTLTTVRCGACVTSCVRTASAPIAAAVERATSWSSTDTAELTSQVSVISPPFEQNLLHTVCSDSERVNDPSQWGLISIAPFPVCRPLWLLSWASALLSGALLRTECCFS